MVIKSRRIATHVHIADAHYRANRDWFHLPPSRPVDVSLRCLDANETESVPDGKVRAINLSGPLFDR